MPSAQEAEGKGRIVTRWLITGLPLCNALFLTCLKPFRRKSEIPLTSYKCYIGKEA